MTHGVIHDPDREWDRLPLDRETHLQLAVAVLNWPQDGDAAAADCTMIALQLAAHARLLASDIRRRFAHMPPTENPSSITVTVLGEADRRLSQRPPARGTIAHAQRQARLVQALYQCFDRTTTKTCTAPLERAGRPMATE